MLTFLQSQNDRTLMKGYRRVAFVEEFWDILKQIHNNNGLHAGVKKTFARVRKYTDCIKLAGLFGQ